MSYTLQMKKTFLLPLFAVALGSTQAQANATPCALLLGGVCWAEANVSVPGEFAPRPDMYTAYYRWRRPHHAWAATGIAVSEWNDSGSTGSAWAATPCPQGWRLPTPAEFTTLHAAGSTWAEAGAKGNAVAGRFYGPFHAFCRLPSSMGGCIFLPACGWRANPTGVLGYQSANGYYWSSVQSSKTNGQVLYFYSMSSNPSACVSKAHGVSVRCVRE